MMRKRNSMTIRERLKDSEYLKRWVAKSQKGAAMTKHRYVFTTKDRSVGGKNVKHRTPPNIVYYYDKERKVREQIAPLYDRWFNPRVCDGIAFKGTTMEIIEIKTGTGQLNDNQRRLQEYISKVEHVKYRIIHTD